MFILFLMIVFFVFLLGGCVRRWARSGAVMNLGRDMKSLENELK